MYFIRNYFLRLLFLLPLFNPSLLIAQGLSSSTYVPNVIPPSPNATALMKFTDVPVSPYTGTADITVPIYTIQAKGISVPVSLSYHTGGIRLKEEASSVGLGWALNAGGVVSRTIMDHDDFGAIPYFTTDILQLAGDMSITQPYPPSNQPYLGPNFYDFFCTYLAAKTTGNEDYYKAFNSGSDNYDMEPDIFSYNFPGHSGKFIITRLGKVVLQKQENINIQFLTNGSSFTITDDQGNKFYFNTQETCTTGGSSVITSWRLSKIVTEQQDSVIFNYTPGGGGIVQPDVNQTFNAYCSNAGGPFSTNPLKVLIMIKPYKALILQMAVCFFFLMQIEMILMALINLILFSFIQKILRGLWLIRKNTIFIIPILTVHIQVAIHMNLTDLNWIA